MLVTGSIMSWLRSAMSENNLNCSRIFVAILKGPVDDVCIETRLNSYYILI